MATMLFNNLITFSRGTNATLTGPTGLIQWAPSNLLTYSEQFDNAAWTKTNATITANSTTAPDGTTTADKLAEDAANSTHYANGSTTTTAASYAFSCYIKAAERSFVLLWNSTANFGRVFDLAGGTVSGTVAGVNQATADIANVGNGWYRCTIYGTCTAASNSFRAYTMTDATTFTYAGTAGSGIYIWGAQLELGTTATTYNSTTVKNLLGYSEAFDNAAWTKTRASIVTGAAANPVNGLFNAQKLMEDTTATNSHFTRQTVSTPANAVAFSAYIKAAERTAVRLVNASYGNAAYFGLTGSGSVGTTDSATGAIASVGNGWYRCTLFFTQTVAGSVSFDIRTANGTTGGSDNYTGDGNSGVYIWGAQLSDSGSLDPYVPTPGAAPTSAAYYGPRFDYDPVTLAPKGLLIEEARTNLLTYSSDFSNAVWTPTNATVSTNTTTAPDGTTTADTLVEDATAGVTHRVYATPACSANTAYTYTAYVKAAGRTQVRLLETTLGGAIFDLSTATVVSTDGGVTSAIQNAGNGWYRCRISATTGAAQTLFVSQIQGAVAGSWTYTGSGAAALYIWGAQLEAGAFATSYIPTVASTVTRSADVATLTGTNFAPWYNQSAGTVVTNFDTAIVSTATGVVFGGGSNVFQTKVEGGRARSGIRAVVDLITGTGPTVSMPGSSSVASAYKTGDNAIAANGGAAVTSAVTFTATGGALVGLGFDGLTNANWINGHIRSVTYYPDRASNTQLQSITT